MSSLVNAAHYFCADTKVLPFTFTFVVAFTLNGHEKNHVFKVMSGFHI